MLERKERRRQDENDIRGEQEGRGVRIGEAAKIMLILFIEIDTRQ